MSEFLDTRITERRYYRIPPTLLTANGTTDGKVTIASTYKYKVGQKVTLRSNTQQPVNLKIKGVISETEILVGTADTNIVTYADVSAFLTADAAEIVVPEQRRHIIPEEEIERAVYEEEPTLAYRSHLVDYLGRSYDICNPMPVQLSDGSIEIGTVNAELEVQLSHQDNVPDPGDVADSVQVGDGTEILQINPDGSIDVNIIGAGGSGVVRNLYGEVSSVASATTTTVTSYTVPVGKTAVLDLVEFSGCNIATYEVDLNATNIAKKRTWFNGNLADQFFFSSSNASGIALSAGDVVRLRVTHARPSVGDFEGRIQVIEK